MAMEMGVWNGRDGRNGKVKGDDDGIYLKNDEKKSR